MALVEITPSSVVVDGTDVSASVRGWRVEQWAREHPVVVLDLLPDLEPRARELFAGHAVVKVTAEEQTVDEFLAAVDPQWLTDEALAQGALDEGPIVTVLRLLRELARGRA